MKKLLFVLLSVSSYITDAATKTSIANSNWNTAATWSPSGVPAAGDVVIINTNVTLNVATNSLASLTINSGKTLTNGGYALKVNNTTSSTFTNNGTYTNTGTSTTTITGSFINSGTYSSSTETFKLTGNFTNSGSYTNGKATTIAGNLVNSTTSSNYTNGTGTTTVTVGNITNSGTLSNSTGTLKLTGNFYNNGNYTTTSTGTTTITGSLTNTTNYTNGSGSTTVTSGNIENSGTYSNTSGTLALTGNFTNSGTYITGASTTTIKGNLTDSTASSTYTNGSGSTTVTTGNITNSGTYTNTTGTLTLTGTLTNNSGATYTNGAGTTAITGSFTNSGTYTNTSGKLSLTGNLTNNGTFTDNAGTVSFIGTSTQAIINKISFYDLTIDGTGPMTTSDSIWVRDGLALTKGTLTVASGILILKNDAVNNGRVISVGTGNITGTFLAEKWISRCNADWSSYGSCMSQTVSSFDLYTTGFSGCPYYPSYSWVNMYTYNEAASGSYTIGYVAPSSTSTTITRGMGFLYWFENYSGGKDFPRILPMQGTLNFQATFTFPVTCTNNSTAANIGWNLVSNPFPGTIDWKATSGWTKTKMNNAIYVWNTCNSVYSSYTGGVGTNAGSRYIPEGQGFFVHAKKTTSALKATSAVIVNNTTQALLTPLNPDSVNNVLKIDLGEDEIAIRLDSSATDQNDSLFDATELFSDSTRLCSYVYSDTADIYSINSVKDTDQVIPVKIRKSGTLVFSGINSFLGQYNIYLKDLQNGSYQQLFEGFEYPYTDTTTSTFQTRFEIHFSKIITTGVKEIVANNSASINYDAQNIYVNFNFANPLTTQIIVYNLLGQEIEHVSGTFYQEKNYALNRPNVPVIVEILAPNQKVVKKVF